MVRPAMAVQLADEPLDGATLVAVRLVGVAVEVLVVAHPAGEAAEALVDEHLAGVEMVDAQPMVEEMDHERRTEAAMALEQHTAAQQLTVALHRTVEQQRTAVMTATALHMVASAPEVAHLHGEGHRVTRPRSREVYLLQRRGHTTHLLQARTPLRRLADMVRTLHPHQVAHLWMLLHPATTLRRLREIALAVDTALLLPPHRVAGTLQPQLRAVILATTRVVRG